MPQQQREDFQALHVHKDAGMQFTIILAAEPLRQVFEPSEAEGALVLRLRRCAPGATFAQDPPGVATAARLAIEDVLVGDERRWQEVRIDRMTPAALARLVEQDAVEGQIVLVLAAPLLQALALGAE